MQTLDRDAQRRSTTVVTQPLKEGRTVVVATRFVVRHRRHTLPFLRAALASAREAQAVPGFLGGTVLADLWNRRFWTVSVWASPEAVRSYGSASAHAEAMRRTEDWAAEARVERWRTHTFQVPSLVETAMRLGAPGPRRGLVRHLRPDHPPPAASDSATRGPEHGSAVAAAFPPPPDHQHGLIVRAEGSS
jgi:heme-degrading monooxygenase HmoA